MFCTCSTWLIVELDASACAAEGGNTLVQLVCTSSRLLVLRVDGAWRIVLGAQSQTKSKELTWRHPAEIVVTSTRLLTNEELCEPTLNGRGGPIAPINIQANNFGLKNDMIQQVQNSCQFHGLPGDDANKHLDKFLHVTQSIKVNGVTDDALRLYLFPHSLTHHATAWFDRLPRNSITTFDQMASKFLSKYFPPSMVTKLRNEITNFRQLPDESLFEAWERYKLAIDRCPNHNMLPVTQIDTFYNGLTLRHRDTINAAAGGTFMKRRPEECYDLIENMTAHHNDWDTSAQRCESSSSITSSNAEIAALKNEMSEMNKNFLKMFQNQQINSVTPSYETCGGPHPYHECQATSGHIQNVYAAGAYNQGGNTYQPQGNRNLLSYRSDNYLRPPGFNVNQNQNQNNQNQNYQNRNQGNNQGNNQGRNQFFQRASQVQNPNPNYKALAYQVPIHQPQVVASSDFSNYVKANDAVMRNMQTQMTSLTSSNIELKNMFGQFMKMNTASTSGSGSLPGNTIDNPKGDVKAITTSSDVSYDRPKMDPTTSPLPVEEEFVSEVTTDKVQTLSPKSTAHVQPSVIQTLVLEPDVAPKPNPKPSLPYPSRLKNQKLRERDNNQMSKFLKIFQRIHFDLIFADALVYMPKFAATFKKLLSNKEKLFELSNTLLNENCSAVLLKKLPEKLGDPDRFLIPCNFIGMVECFALADLELADRMSVKPLGVAEDIFVKVDKFNFPTDFVVVDCDVNTRVPLILGRPFLRTAHALIDVHGEELTLRVEDEAVTFKVGQTSRYSSHYDESMNRIHVIDVACEEYAPEVLGISKSGNPTSPSDLMIDSRSPSFTPFGGSDFPMEEIDAFLE
ncbi:reverse transcriptase domain-containing protein [Tanacetum coccineum]